MPAACWKGGKGCKPAKDASTIGGKILVEEAFGVAIGFVGTNTIGTLVETMARGKPATKDSTNEYKLLGWAANNIPKALLYLIIGKLWDGAFINGVQKAMAGSMIIDTIARLANNGASSVVDNPGCYKLGQLKDNIQENTELRNQLSDALQRLVNNSSQNDQNYGHKVLV